MRTLILSIALLLFAPHTATADFGILGGGVGRVIIYGDSLSNPDPAVWDATDCPWCTPLTSAGYQIWNLSRGGSKSYDDVTGVSINACRLGGTDADYWGCEMYGERQVARLDGACRRVFGHLNAADGFTDIAAAYVGDTDLVSCLEDLPTSGTDVDVFFFDVNGIGQFTNAQWDATYENLSFRAHDVMLDASRSNGHACVIVLGPPLLRTPNYVDSDVSNLKLHAYLRARAADTYSHCVLADVYSMFRNIQTARGDAIFHSMYTTESGGCPNNCVHPADVSALDATLRPNDLIGGVILSAINTANVAHRTTPNPAAAVLSSIFTTESGTEDLTADSFELGVVFNIDCATSPGGGYLHGVRFYKHAGNTGTHVGHLFPSVSGAVLRTQTFVSETASGWQDQLFTDEGPYNLTCGVNYVASYSVLTGHYSSSTGTFTGAELTNGPITFVATADDLPASIGNGRYHVNPNVFPSSSVPGANFYVDILWSEDL